jgi:hypothetical protein
MLPTNTQGPVVHQAFATWTMSTRLPFGRCARTEASEEIQVAAYSTVPFLCAAPKRVRSAEQPRWFGGAQPVGMAGQTPCSAVAFQSLKSQQFQELPGEHVRGGHPHCPLYSEVRMQCTKPSRGRARVTPFRPGWAGASMCFRRENDGAAEPRKPRPRGSDPGTPWAAASGGHFLPNVPRWRL